MKKLLILVDGSIFSYQVHGGISNYHIGLIDNQPSNIQHIIIAPFYLNISLHNSSFPIFGLYIPRELKSYLAVKFLLRISLVLIPLISTLSYLFLLFFGWQVMIQLTYSRKLSPFYKLPFIKNIIYTIHDMIPEKYPSLFLSNSIASQQKIQHTTHCNFLLFVSSTTLNDFSRFVSDYPYYLKAFGKCSTFITHNTVRKSFLNLVRKNPIKLYNKYLFFMTISGSAPYKNLSLYIDAAFHFQHILDLTFLVIGNSEEIIQSFPLLPSNLQIVQPDDTELVSMYYSSLCYVSCSLDEGFDIPLLESAASNTPIVCSDIAVHREIYEGSSVEFFDPCNCFDLILILENHYVNFKSTNRRMSVDYSELVEIFTAVSMYSNYFEALL